MARTRRLWRVPRNLPLVGHLAFGLVDRGTNLLQVRPTTLCPLSCIFCSVDAGPSSRKRATEYLVSLDHLLEWFEAVARFKGVSEVQAHIDSVGDPLTYPWIVELVERLSKMPMVGVVSLETHGARLTAKLADALDDAGLSRINLSIDAVDPELAKKLAGAPWFDVKKVLEVARYIASSLRMDLLIAPVWVPGVNDREIPKLIEFALEIGAGKRWPPLGIQKYEAHKYGRKPRGVRPMSWQAFYRRLRRWEDEYGVKLILRPEDFGIRRAPSLPKVMRRGEKVKVRVVGPGWWRGQWLGEARGRLVAIVGVRGEPPLGAELITRVLRDKDNIYVVEPV